MIRTVVLCLFLTACGGKATKTTDAPAEETTEAAPTPVEEAAPPAEEPAAEPDPEAESTKAAATEPDAATGPGADGDACLTASDCASGVCEGMGCGEDMPGTCATKMRPCTKDLRAYCGCDGETFRGSGSCPGQRYSKKGPCEDAK